MTSKQVAEVERNNKGQVVKGTPNPGGLTALEREARDAVRQALSGPLRAVGLAAYERLLLADNPTIVSDFMNRLAGKVKERVSIEDEAGNSVSPLAILLQQFRALPRTAQDAIEVELAKGEK